MTTTKMAIILTAKLVYIQIVCQHNRAISVTKPLKCLQGITELTSHKVWCSSRHLHCRLAQTSSFAITLLQIVYLQQPCTANKTKLDRSNSELLGLRDCDAILYPIKYLYSQGLNNIIVQRNKLYNFSLI